MKLKNNKKFDIKVTGNGRPVVCVVGGVHGDERIGKKVIGSVRKISLMEGTLKTIIANPLALQKRKRFIDADLNRCFPGKQNGNYEERIAYDLSGHLKQADFVIDVHSTTTNVKDLAIIKMRNNLVHNFNPKRVVLMPKGIGEGSLINYCHAGVSFEYGPHDSMYTYRRSLQDINKVLYGLKMIKNNPRRKIFKTDYFKIYGTIKKPEGIKMRKSIENFMLIRKGETLGMLNNKPILAKENFYPVLFGPKAYKDIMGFKAKKIAS